MFQLLGEIDMSDVGMFVLLLIQMRVNMLSCSLA